MTQRLLVRAPNWLGDAVMSLPALQRLRESRPAAHITVLTTEKLAELWAFHPAIDAVLTVAPGEGVWSLGRRLRAGGFDLALVLPNSPRSALEVWLGRIPQRVGFARPWRHFLLTHPVPPRPQMVRMRKRSVSEIKRLIAQAAQPSTINHQPSTPQSHQLYDYLHLAAALGANPLPLAPRLVVPPAEVEKVLAKFLPDSPVKSEGRASSPSEPWAAPARSESSPYLADFQWAAMIPGAEYGPAKRWPAAMYARAAATLSPKVRWLILGGPKDQPLAGEVAALMLQAGVSQVQNLAGKTTLRELCAVLRACRVALSNDTGPMHLAAAVGTPVVAPFGSTSPELTGPGLPGDAHSPHVLLTAHAPCAPCFRRQCPVDFRCLRGITPEQVVQAVLTVLARP